MRLLHWIIVLALVVVKTTISLGAENQNIGAATPDWNALTVAATRAIEANPADITLYIYRGRLYLAQHRFAEASQDITKALEKDPNNASLLFLRAETLFRLKDFDGSILDYTQYLKLRPDSIAAHVNRGSAFRKKKLFDQAIADETAALVLSPDDALAYWNRAKAYEGKRAFDPALSDFDKAVSFKPSASNYVSRGILHALRLEYAAAKEDFAGAIRVSPSSDIGYNDMAWLLATCPDPAFRDGKTALLNAWEACGAAQWNKSAPVDTLAAAYAETGDFEKAINWELKFLTYPIDDFERQIGREHLALYRSHQSCHRQSWESDNS